MTEESIITQAILRQVAIDGVSVVSAEAIADSLAAGPVARRVVAWFWARDLSARHGLAPPERDGDGHIVFRRSD